MVKYLSSYDYLELERYYNLAIKRINSTSNVTWQYGRGRVVSLKERTWKACGSNDVLCQF